MRCLLPLCFAAVTLGWATPTVQIFTELPSPQPVGTVIGLSVIGKDEGEPEKYASLLRYRLSATDESGRFHIIRDFSRQSEFTWTPELYDYEARVKVTVLNTKTKQSGETEVPFRISPRVAGQSPVVAHTAHPLIALFSFPACPEGSQFRVAFQRQGEALTRRTGLSPCRASHTSNLYVAGMRPDSEYALRAEVISGDNVKTGLPVSFRTGMVDKTFGRFNVAVAPDERASKSESLVLFTSPSRPTMASMATDLEGNVVWYLPALDRHATRMLSGGRFLTFSAATNGRTPSNSEVDLLGHTLRETDIVRVAEQLEEFKIKSICKANGQQCASGFHHEAIELPNGHIIAVGTLERVIPDGAQGSEDPVNIAGTLLFDLDRDLQVKWVWNSFDHLDVKRASLADGHCRGPVGSLPCAPVVLTAAANDWLHGNAVSYSRNDRNLTLSLPDQDWVIKIDYDDGKGSGKVLWKLGQDGDFKAETEDPKPWFSHQHDAAFEPPGSNMLVLLDNGLRRVVKGKDKEKDKEPNTRGQVWRLDEKTRTATLVTNADLGAYSPNVGSAQRLSNGNYHFTTGAVRKDNLVRSRSVEVTPDGKIVYLLETPGNSTYRSNRVVDLYTPNIR
jgi:arylsulfate sulfotransferase